MVNKSKVLLLGAAFLSLSATAQDLNGQFTGDISSAPGFVTDAGATSVTVNFTYDTTVPLNQSSPDYFTYVGALKSVSYEFFDAQGQPIDFGLPSSFQIPTGATTGNLAGSFDYGGNYSFNTIDYTVAQENYFGYFNLSSNQVSPLMQPLTDYPRFQLLNNQANAFNSILIIRAPNTLFSGEWINLNVHSLSYGILDADGDGVVDAEDSCSASLLDETVLFDGWYDSGVTNYVDADGCSVMDHYAACEAVVEEAPRRGIRSVRSGPSSCEKAVSYDLVADGVISYAEARMLRAALYESSTATQPD
ncbi:hypothetical protein [Pseudidiomarina sp.]|uniref:hypothetical protein n=1 Tax=Pseudidiomarina sp. TaxID=2081707 RepID=UPI003A96C7EB